MGFWNFTVFRGHGNFGRHQQRHYSYGRWAQSPRTHSLDVTLQAECQKGSSRRPAGQTFCGARNGKAFIPFIPVLCQPGSNAPDSAISAPVGPPLRSQTKGASHGMVAWEWTQARRQSTEYSVHTVSGNLFGVVLRHYAATRHRSTWYSPARAVEYSTYPVSFATKWCQGSM